MLVCFERSVAADNDTGYWCYGKGKVELLIDLKVFGAVSDRAFFRFENTCANTDEPFDLGHRSHDTT